MTGPYRDHDNLHFSNLITLRVFIHDDGTQVPKGFASAVAFLSAIQPPSACFLEVHAPVLRQRSEGASGALAYRRMKLLWEELNRTLVRLRLEHRCLLVVDVDVSRIGVYDQIPLSLTHKLGLSTCESSSNSFASRWYGKQSKSFLRCLLKRSY